MKRFLGIVLLLFITQLNGYCFEVEQVIWGFNGKVVPNRINPVSLLLSNPNPEAFESALVLEKIWFGGKPVGAPLVKPVFLGPFAKRWVQFYPFIKDGKENFKLFSALVKSKSYNLKQPKTGAAATVLLIRPDYSFISGKMQIFPENLFPSSVAATTGLNCVVVDHNPEFSPVQKESFLDWIKQGGIVQLIKTRKGDYPVFSGTLQVLNSKQSELKVGAGVVLKKNIQPHELSYDSLAKAGYKTPAMEKGKTMDGFYTSVDDIFFKRLKILVRTDHNWLVIFALAILYLLLVGPANYFLARKRRNYKLVISFFLITVLLFSLLFSYIGRRGYGERTIINDFTYAHNMGNGEFNVTQWMNVFVTSGDLYRIYHEGSHSYYSTCQDEQQVKGDILNGKDGRFNADIPLFSSIQTYHKGKMKADDHNLKIVSFKESGNQITKLEIESISMPGSVRRIFLLYKNRLYRMSWQGNKIILAAGNKGQNFNNFVKDNFNNNRFIERYNRKDESRDKIYDSMVPLLMAKCQGGVPCFGEYIYYPEKRNRLQVFIVAETPEAFYCKSEQFKLEKGNTVYHYDLSSNKPTRRSL